MSIVPRGKGKTVAPPNGKTSACAPGDILLVSTQTGPIGIPRGQAVGTLTVYFGTKQASLTVPLVIQ